MGLNPIPSSMREKSRYIAFEVLPKGNFDKKQVVHAVMRSARGFLGEKGVGSASLQLVEWSNGKGVLKCARSSLNDAKLVLGLVKDIEGAPAVFHITRVSGILKKARS